MISCNTRNRAMIRSNKQLLSKMKTSLSSPIHNLSQSNLSPALLGLNSYRNYHVASNAQHQSHVSHSVLSNVNLIHTSSSISSNTSSYSRKMISQPTRTYADFSRLTPVPNEIATKNFETMNEMINFSIKLFANDNMFGTYHPDPAHPKGKHYEYITYKEFGEEIENFRKVLQRFHVGKNSKVAIISNNRVEWAVALYAVTSLGGQLVPMYEAQLEKDWKYIVQDSSCMMILAATEKVYDVVKSYPGTVGNIQAVLCFDSKPDFMHSYRRWMNMIASERPSASPSPPYNIMPEDGAVIIYTSGTTGNPKGVVLTHHNIISNILGIRDVWTGALYRYNALCFLPWAHVFGQVAELQSMIAMGSTLHIVSQREHLLECLPIAKPAIISSVPMLFNKIYDGVQKKLLASSPIKKMIASYAFSVSRKRNVLMERLQPVPMLLNLQHKLVDRIVFAKIRANFGGNLVFMPSGGAGVAMKVLEFFEDIGVPICEGYGLTETSPVISASTPDWRGRRLGCVGTPLPNLDVRIFDHSTSSAFNRTSSAEGEIIVHGPSVMPGYHNNEAANDEVFMYYDGKKFFRTGDLGRFVDGKFLKITGRLKEQYKLENGKYVVPAPLEDDVCRSQFIAQALIYGDNKPYNVVLLFADHAEVKNYLAKKNKTPSSGMKAEEEVIMLNRLDDVVQLIAQELNEVSSIMKSFERPLKFILIDEGFTQENQLLTPKMSLRRKNIIDKYKNQIEAMYQDKAGVVVSRNTKNTNNHE